jgi:flagellin-like protein
MKGISPLIATIMLIAFALVVSGIFYGWVSQFAYSQREEFQICSRAQIVLQKAYYNPESGNINIIIYNTGDVPLKGFTLLISRDKTYETNRDFLQREIAPTEIGLFPVAYSSGMKSIVVQSVECKNAQDMVGLYDVEGI